MKKELFVAINPVSYTYIKKNTVVPFKNRIKERRVEDVTSLNLNQHSSSTFYYELSEELQGRE